MEDEALIVCVQDYPNIYDLSHPKYHDKNVKLNCWKEIGERFNQPGDNCKSRWKSLRECYRKASLKRETKSGQAAKKLIPWCLEQQMDIVKQYVNVQREQESNISDDESFICESIPELENSQVTKTPSLPGPEPESASNEPGSASANTCVCLFRRL
ncbi:transcription factor Adf-1-like [Homalodisca vitripennis]|uniref:transcription factor Adf-1-like n=1 Tax=Homalodisca vitripennis TaxID=197043 RepID=UPI001EEAAA39|nr:transcription factor Adf-1-like [Homalodisca vitripennis]